MSMEKIFRRVESFFFAPRNATSFGLMRISWALTVFVSMMMELPDITRYYSNVGFVPPSLEYLILRSDLRFTIFNVADSPAFVISMYAALLWSCIFMLLGIFPRISTILSVLLYCSFHEKNPFPLAGGETVLRSIGFLLMISPGIEALSFKRLSIQWQHFRIHTKILGPLMMSAWPKRLLLWEFMIIYITSVWSKLSGDMWIQGTAVAIALEHPHFAKYPQLSNVLSIFSPLFSWATITLELAWALLLVPKRFIEKTFLKKGRLRRCLLVASFLFHLAIQILLIVGTFLYAMTTGLLGLVEGEDMNAVRTWLNKGRKTPVYVLYDGHCGFCMRSVFILLMIDWLHRLTIVNFHNTEARMKVAKTLSFEELDRALHIRLPGGKMKKGFSAFRALTWHIPVLWPLAPFLYLPGVTPIGNRVYAYVANRRQKCTHETCPI